MRPFLYLLICLLPGGFKVHAQQRDVENQQLLWLSYYQKVALTDHWLVHTELEGRWFAESGRQHQWVVPRIHVHYLTTAGADFALGAAYFLQALPQNDEPLHLVRPEIRPHQELSFKQPLGKVKLEHRYRVEERLMRRMSDGALQEGWDFNWRFRYRAQLVIPFAAQTALSPTLKVYEEVMFNAGRNIEYNFFDQNRLGATLNLRVSKQIATELGYLYWFQQRAAGNTFYSRHILRFTLLHSLSRSSSI